MSNKINFSIMAGRPPRRSDPELCRRLEEARQAQRLSRAAVAQMLGTSASNLTRSMTQKAFSRDLSARVEALLEKRAWDVPGAALRTSDPDISALRKSLLLLRELTTMAPDIEKALALAIRRDGNGIGR
ncbi:hypothetical protein ACXR8U_09360 [Methylobacterium radiotolerans]|jgi:transcriptional regulator with XRE-family HTH domain|uniref:hypothetical protein n=1 Tax=Methylobacterium TaxID=407 RepID=UPI0005E7DE05|nr:MULTISPECIES: hypothetical protein [Methylobacterium]MBN6823023.1 hypothetical protein [Methylobacterium organophilum]MCY4509920.1 hypothetical protein [Acidobacteriota bacterium]GAN51447.1 transcriptional regulator [Methylobacterium sp. ME121]